MSFTSQLMMMAKIKRRYTPNLKKKTNGRKSTSVRK